MVHASLTTSGCRAYRRTFWGEVYETVLSWYIARPTTVALFSPKKGKFNVTAKGGLMENNQFDWRIAKPYLILALLNLAGLVFAVWRFIYGPANEYSTVLISGTWVVYNLLIIGVAVAVAAEVRQVRSTHRVQSKLPAAVRLESGHCYPGTARTTPTAGHASTSIPTFPCRQARVSRCCCNVAPENFCFQAPAVTRSQKGTISIRFAEMSVQQKSRLRAVHIRPRRCLVGLARGVQRATVVQLYRDSKKWVGAATGGCSAICLRGHLALDQSGLACVALAGKLSAARADPFPQHF